MMLLGGQILKPYDTPEAWLSHVRELGYQAVYFPVDHQSPRELTEAYRRICEENQLFIAEVGAWSNPLSRDQETARQAFDLCCRQLSLAEEIGAGCCVNIAGSLSEQWDGPHPEHFSTDTFALVVDSVRQIIDAVKPKRTFYTLELMPWMIPDSADLYLDLIRAIDRKAFAVHLDPVNIMTSPRVCYQNADLIKDCFDKLGPYIRSCHAKDVFLESNLTVHINEIIPGEGLLDYRTYLDCLQQLNRPVPLMIEHLSSHDEVVSATRYIRGLARDLQIDL